ncbi:hypothetical protein ACFV6F_39995 [Kitasatospora phosalacinea]|uniref:hypothetical protein n=1 Tax=Kitasatospora phosalacinea TaxID=2065 RepID=UPI00365670C5
MPLLAACGGGDPGSGAASSAAQSDGELGDPPPAEGSGEQPDERMFLIPRDRTWDRGNVLILPVDADVRIVFHPG